MRCCLPVVALLLGVGFAGCQSPPDYSLLRRHVIVARPDGAIIDPKTKELSPPNDDLVVTAVDDLCDAMEQHFLGEDDTVRKLLIYVHGGMIPYSTSLEGSEDVVDEMMGENGSEYYPVFMIWRSDPISSYTEHLVWIRDGHEKKWGPFVSPFYLLTDIGSGIIRLPRTSLDRSIVDVGLAADRAFGWNWFPERRNYQRIYKAITHPTSGLDVDIALGDYEKSRWYNAGSVISWILSVPVKAITGSIFLDGMGHGAWKIMLRRAHNLFRPPSAYNPRRMKDDASLVANARLEPSGGFALLTRELLARIRSAPEGVRYELTLIGHSMGAIILNEFLSHYINEPALNVTRIVYMAPACSIREAELILVPFLKENDDTRFHLLTLHPKAETVERNMAETVPRGSLLEWIDAWYSVPPTHGHRRLGTWRNALPALSIFRDVFPRVAIKGFGVRHDSKPQKHGDFNDCPFWEESFWDPEHADLY